MAKQVGSVRIELLSDGIQQLLSSSSVAEACHQAADRIAAAAGDGFEVSSMWRASFGGGRVAYSVKADTYEAKLAEAEDKALTRAVFACRR